MCFFLTGFTSVLQGAADMQQLLNRLKALEEKQKPSVHSMKKSIVQYAFRQLADFDKYRTLEICREPEECCLAGKRQESGLLRKCPRNITGKNLKAPEQLKKYVLSLLGDRDYEKIMEAVSKVDKSYTQGMSGASHSSDLQSPLPPPNHGYSFPNPPVYHPGAPDPSPQLHYMQPTFPYFPQYPPRRSPGHRNLKYGGATRRNYFCHYCGMNNQILRNCWKRKKDLENKKQEHSDRR